MRPPHRLLGLFLAPALLLAAAPAHAASLYVTISGTFDQTSAADGSGTPPVTPVPTPAAFFAALPLLATLAACRTRRNPC